MRQDGKTRASSARTWITHAAFALLMSASSVHAAVHRSSQFGWTANQDVTEAFGKLLADGQLKAGDELILDHTFRISGSHTLPDDFTLSAVKDAGFDVTDAIEFANNRPLLVPHSVDS